GCPSPPAGNQAAHGWGEHGCSTYDQGESGHHAGGVSAGKAVADHGHGGHTCGCVTETLDHAQCDQWHNSGRNGTQDRGDDVDCDPDHKGASASIPVG